MMFTTTKLGLSPLPATLANDFFFWGSLTKNIIILVVTATGQGDNPITFKLLGATYLVGNIPSLKLT